MNITGAGGSPVGALCGEYIAPTILGNEPVMSFTLKNHITGKVYDLTQENMTAMIRCIDDLRSALQLIVTEYTAGPPYSEFDWFAWKQRAEKALKTGEANDKVD